MEINTVCASSKTYEIILGRKIDLKKAGSKVEVFAELPVAIFAFHKGCAVTIYQSGRVVVKGAENIDELAKELDELLQS